MAPKREEIVLKALVRIADSETRSDRRHRHMVGVDVIESLRRIARIAIETTNEQEEEVTA